jgi:hypothetical protein
MGMFSWFGDSESAPWQRRLRSWIIPAGRPDPEFQKVKDAAAADTDAMLKEDRKYFSQNPPGKHEDDL